VKNDSKISLVLYGNLLNEKQLWTDWYEYAKSFLMNLSLQANFCEIIGDAFKSGKLLKADKCEAKIQKSLNKGEKISLIGLDVLPDDFGSAFEYIAFAKMGIKNNLQYIAISLPLETKDSIDFNTLIDSLKKFIVITSGEIFEMNRKDNPYFYVMKANPPSSFKSLKIIKTI
jgi:hypothetical protein